MNQGDRFPIARTTPIVGRIIDLWGSKYEDEDRPAPLPGGIAPELAVDPDGWTLVQGACSLRDGYDFHYPWVVRIADGSVTDLEGTVGSVMQLHDGEVLVEIGWWIGRATPDLILHVTEATARQILTTT